MPFDFFKGVVEINYNRLPPIVSTAVMDEVGWSEEYFFPFTAGITNVRNQMRNLVAARAALLPLGSYVFRTHFGQASVYKSTYSLNGHAINPVIDFDEGYAQAVEPCNDIEAGAHYRLENGLGRRWNRSITAVRDSWINDMVFQAGNYAWDPSSGLPTPQTAIQSGGQATATCTVSSGAVATVTVTASGNSYQVAPPVFFIGGGNNAIGTTTLTGGTVTGATITAGGSGYTSVPTVWIPPPCSEPWAVMPGQTKNALIANFLSCLANYTINFSPVKVVNTAFPSGFMTQGDTVPTGGSPYTATRVLLQGVITRQRGRIHTTSIGRKKAKI